MGTTIELPLANCKRCKRLCRTGTPDNPQARPFQKSTRGYCAECVFTRFIRDSGVFPDFPVEALAMDHIQNQLARVFEVGQSELKLSDINWDTVIANWDMPFPKR